MSLLHTIPFDLRHNHVILAATVNGRSARLILDTGSSVCTLDRDWAASIGVSTAGAAAAVRGVGDVDVTLATIDSIGIGSAELLGETVALMPFDSVSAAHGVPIHGTIGYSLFARFIVEIDYVAREIRLWEAGGTAERWNGGTRQPGGAGAWHVMPVDLTYRVPVVDARFVPTTGDAFSARLVFDLGTSGFSALLNPRKHAAHREALDAAPFIATNLGAGIGGTTSGRVTRVECLELGSLSVRRPTVALAGSSAGFFGVTWADGTVGAPVFSAGTVVLDYQRNRVIVETVGSESDTAFGVGGLQFRGTGPEFARIEVSDIVTGSSADRANIRVGDRLLAVDGETATGEGLDRIIRRMRASEAVDLTVARDGVTRVVRVALEQLV